jgi:hypothetical protein
MKQVGSRSCRILKRMTSNMGCFLSAMGSHEIISVGRLGYKII